MELDKVFRHKERQLYEHVGHLTRRYRQLRGRFTEFLKFFPTEKGVFPPETVFRPNPDVPELVVQFCGKDYAFVFEMVDGGARGRVRCLMPTKYDDGEPRELGRFEFTGEGITSISPPGGKGADPLDLRDGAAALAIVASFICASFDE